MTKQHNEFPPIPLKRYFSLEELCSLSGLEVERFLEWQSQHNMNFGQGGQFYFRQDILSLRSISPMIIKMQSQPRIEDVLSDLSEFGRSVDEAKGKLLSVLSCLNGDKALTP